MPGDAAVLVDDDGELQPRAAQGGHECVAVEGLRHGGHRLDVVAQRAAARAGPGTAKACLTWTTPRTVSGSSAQTGKREMPVRRAVGDEVGEGVVGGEGGDPGTRGHEVARRPGR